jgi:hypothetical protein
MEVAPVAAAGVVMLPPLMVPRYGHACTKDRNTILVAGGRGLQGPLNLVEAFNFK